jgi:excisionase family DNA binding protein
MSSSSGIMGIKEMADYLNMKEQTVYRLVQQKKIPAIKIGGQWKVKQQHLDKMFDDMLQEKIMEIQSQ